MPGRIGFAPKLHSTGKSSELRGSCNLGVTKARATAAGGGAEAESVLARNTPPSIRVITGLFELTSQDAAMGALRTLRAATDPGVLGGQYCGPGGFGELRGYPKVVASNARSHDVDLQKRLWAVSEELTGVGYPVG